MRWPPRRHSAEPGGSRLKFSSLRQRLRDRKAGRELVPAISLCLLFGIALILIGIGAAAVPSAFDDQPKASRVDGNRPVNAGALDLADIRSHNSPTLVRNPRDGRELAVANRIDSPRFSCALHLSRNGGASWRPIAIPAPRGEEPKCFAPDVAYGADGRLYLSFVTLKGNGNVPNAVWLSRLNGRVLSRPKKLLGRLSFQVRLTADPVKPGRLYLTWLKVSDVGLYQFSEPGNPITFMRSDDGGGSWTKPTRISGTSRPRVVAPSMAVGPEGDLNAVYLDLGGDRLDYTGAHRGRGGPPYPGRWKLVLTRSEDGGRSWKEAEVEPKLTPTDRFIVFLPIFPSIAADREDGRLYVSYHDGRLGDPDVRLWTSSDRGASWSEGRRVNDTEPGDNRTQTMSKVAVAPNGRVDVVYYDRRRDPRDIRNHVSLQSSFDGGETFSKHLQLTERPFDSRIGFGGERGLPDLGSRLGLVSADAGALAVWPDTRAGTRPSRKQDLAAGLVTFSRPARLSDAAESALRLGGTALVLGGLGLVGWWAAVALANRRQAGRTAVPD